MSSQLVTSVSTAYLTHAGCANSFFNGNTPSELGNIESATGADQLRTMYNNTAAMQWTGTIDSNNVPAIDDAGQFAVINTLTAIQNLGADYQCRRAGSIITSGGRIQQAISTNNGQPITLGDARFCIYYPSEDFNQEVISIEYTTTDGADIMGGNNIDNLVDLTGRMKDFSGNNGPVCNGTAINDLFDNSLSIFKLGCLVTWETGNTGGDVIIVAPSP
jgi:hypothetical protein